MPPESAVWVNWKTTRRRGQGLWIRQARGQRQQSEHRPTVLLRLSAPGRASARHSGGGAGGAACLCTPKTCPRRAWRWGTRSKAFIAVAPLWVCPRTSSVRRSTCKCPLGMRRSGHVRPGPARVGCTVVCLRCARAAGRLLSRGVEGGEVWGGGGGYCFSPPPPRGRALFGALASPGRPTHPPTSEKCASGKEWNFSKGPKI